MDNRKTGQLGGQQKDGTTRWTTERPETHNNSLKGGAQYRIEDFWRTVDDALCHRKEDGHMQIYTVTDA